MYYWPILLWEGCGSCGFASSHAMSIHHRGAASFQEWFYEIQESASWFIVFSDKGPNIPLLLQCVPISTNFLSSSLALTSTIKITLFCFFLCLLVIHSYFERVCVSLADKNKGEHTMWQQIKGNFFFFSILACIVSLYLKGTEKSDNVHPI